MVCYVVPLITTLIIYARRGSFTHSFWLLLMLAGGSLFGLVDHLWNGELFLISEAWMMDLSLGFTITLSIFGTWGMIVHKNGITESMGRISQRIGILRKQV